MAMLRILMDLHLARLGDDDDGRSAPHAERLRQFARREAHRAAESLRSFGQDFELLGPSREDDRSRVVPDGVRALELLACLDLGKPKFLAEHFWRDLAFGA